MPRATRAGDDREYSERDAEARELARADEKGNLWLPDPPPDKVYRWVRELSLGQPDAGNMGYRWRQGWRPIPASRWPDLVVHVSIPGEEKAPPQVIRWSGLIACEIDKHLWQGLQAKLSGAAAKSMLAVAKSTDETGAQDKTAFVDQNRIEFGRARAAFKQ